MARSGLALLAAALVLSGCVSARVADLPPAPELPPTTATTQPEDTSDVALPGVRPGPSGVAAPPFGPGRATIIGVVSTPQGPLPGAVVRAERFADGGVATADVTTGPDGAFAFPNILGGRFRLRAWKPAPDNWAATTGTVLYLGGAETKGVNLAVEQFSGLVVSSDIAPPVPYVNRRVALAVVVADRSVDTGGVVRAVPRDNAQVELFGPGDWRVLTANPTTAPGGRARWELVCQQVGSQPLSVLVDNAESRPLDLPACQTVPPTTTTEATTTTAPDETTTTGLGGGLGPGRPSTTTTSRSTTTTSRSTTTTSRSTTTTRGRP